MSNLFTKYFKEPYVNVICVELAININEYKHKRTVNIVVGLVLAVLGILGGIVLKNILLIILGIAAGYYGYRRQYLKVKRKERKTREQLIKLYPLFVQTFISLLYTNDNLIKVFLLLENYHFDPYIDRALVIMINKYQVNPENSELIFAEFCNIFDISSASLLHQLMVNISRYGVNDSEINLLEAKINQECDMYFTKITQDDSRKVIVYGTAGVVAFVAIILGVLVSTL